MNNSTRQSAINIHSREDKEEKKIHVTARSTRAKCTRNQVNTNLIVMCPRVLDAWYLRGLLH